MRWRTENPTAECPGSRVQRVEAGGAELVDAVVLAFMPDTMLR
jgi:hypothetical protein